MHRYARFNAWEIPRLVKGLETVRLLETSSKRLSRAITAWCLSFPVSNTLTFNQVPRKARQMSPGGLALR